MTNEGLRARRADAVTPGAASVHPFSPSKAKGAYVWDVEGKRYLDFSTGIAVMNIGHSHPAVVDAVKKQVEEFQHLCFAVGMHPSYIELAERLNALAPGDSPKKTFLANSGAEAVENAVKIARTYTGRPGIVAFTHAFHGRTYMAFSLTGKANPYKAGFGLRAAEVYRAPYPYHFRNPWGAKTEEETGEAALAVLKDLVEVTIGAGEVAAFIIEPIAGEGLQGEVDHPRVRGDLRDEGVADDGAGAEVVGVHAGEAGELGAGVRVALEGLGAVVRGLHAEPFALEPAHRAAKLGKLDVSAEWRQADPLRMTPGRYANRNEGGTPAPTGRERRTAPAFAPRGERLEAAHGRAIRRKRGLSLAFNGSARPTTAALPRAAQSKKPRSGGARLSMPPPRSGPQ